LDKAKVLGILGGFIFFIIIILIFILINSDFDTQLISSVEYGVSAHKLIPQIENEHQKEILKAKRHLESHVTDVKYWESPNLTSEDNFAYYTGQYNTQIKSINELENIREQYVRKKISKIEFLDKINDLKPILEST
jgi:hypothetical protein